MLSNTSLSPLRRGCDITRARPHSPLYTSYSECSVCATLCDVVCNNHSPAPIYGGYLPRTGVYFGSCCAFGAVSACCTCHMCCYMCVLWSLDRTWCHQCCCTCRMCGLYVCVVVLGVHLLISVLAALGICVMFCGAWSAPGAVSACCTCRMCLLYVCVVVLGAHLLISVLAALCI